MTRLLIVACSRAKRPDAGSLPAIDRYDGPAFRLLRRARGHAIRVGRAREGHLASTCKRWCVRVSV